MKPETRKAEDLFPTLRFIHLTPSFDSRDVLLSLCTFQSTITQKNSGAGLAEMEQHSGRGLDIMERSRGRSRGAQVAAFVWSCFLVVEFFFLALACVWSSFL